MNRQQAFETAIKGVINQGGPSVELHNNRVICVYRQKDTGRKCGIGHILTDKQYKSKYDQNGGHPAKYLSVAGILPTLEDVKGISETATFYGVLQVVHDLPAKVGGRKIIKDDKFLVAFKKEAMDFAQAYGLDHSFIQD